MTTEPQPRSYTRAEAQRYVRLLGCWTYTSPHHALSKRDPKEYKALLHKLITVNKTRTDQAGVWETEAAKEVLSNL